MNNNEKLTLSCLVLCSMLASALVLLIHGLGTGRDCSDRWASPPRSPSSAPWPSSSLASCTWRNSARWLDASGRRCRLGTDLDSSRDALRRRPGLRVLRRSRGRHEVPARVPRPAEVLAQSWKSLVYSIGFASAVVVGGRVFRMLFPLTALTLLAFSLATWGALRSRSVRRSRFSWPLWSSCWSYAR